jgi:lipoprotein-releasing system permease protein
MRSMSYELFIALRYLTAKRKQTFVSVISLISVLGVIVGVAALIIALALMTGFQQDIREKILGANAHLTVFGSWAQRPIEDPDRVVRLLLGVPGIAAAAPVVLEKGLVISDLNPGGTAVMLKGIRLDQERHVTDLARKVVSGDLNALSRKGGEGREGIALGKDLAAALGVAPGDRVRIILPQLQMTPFLPMPKSRPFEVVALIDSGFYDYDSTRAYLDLGSAQAFGSLGSAATVIEARTTDLSRLKEIGEEAQRRLGKDYFVNDLIAMNKTFFTALNLEKLLMSIAVGLIVVVAALNIITVLILMVMEKVRDIGTLVALGAAPGGITRIFMFQGILIGVFGTAVGCLLGLGLCWGLDTYHVVKLPVEVYYIPYVPFKVRGLDVALVCFLSVAASFLATLYPSSRAGRLDAVEALRYE